MSRKDFIAVAESIRLVRKRIPHLNENVYDNPSTVAESVILDLVGYLCADFKASNSNFNRVRFLKACGYDE